MADIHVLFQNTTFDPDQLKRMGDAYDLVRRALPDADSYNIARAIIGMAEGGIVDTGTLAARTLDLLGHPESRTG